MTSTIFVQAWVPFITFGIAFAQKSFGRFLDGRSLRKDVTNRISI